MSKGRSYSAACFSIEGTTREFWSIAFPLSSVSYSQEYWRINNLKKSA
jgi:hypothetical protein